MRTTALLLLVLAGCFPMDWQPTPCEVRPCAEDGLEPHVGDDVPMLAPDAGPDAGSGGGDGGSGDGGSGGGAASGGGGVGGGGGTDATGGGGASGGGGTDATGGGSASGQACQSNACVPARLAFSTSWQTLPGTSVEFRCAGTVTATPSGGTRCYRANGDPVLLRINGAIWLLYPGCDGLRDTNCMTSIAPSGATYKDYEVNAGGRLLCDAMGWPLLRTLADKNPGTAAGDVAVVQTQPTVVGTAQGLKNYGTYVNCEP